MQQQVEVPSKEKCRMQVQSLTVIVEPGMLNGDTVHFKSMGEQQPNKLPGDVVLTLKEAKHDTFKRTGLDLHAEISLSLKEALLGFKRTIVHLDGRKINVSYGGVTKPFAIIRITGEGMPQRSDPSERGQLIIKCRIEMPEDGQQWLKEMRELA